MRRSRPRSRETAIATSRGSVHPAPAAGPFLKRAPRMPRISSSWWPLVLVSLLLVILLVQVPCNAAKLNQRRLGGGGFGGSGALRELAGLMKSQKPVSRLLPVCTFDTKCAWNRSSNGSDFIIANGTVNNQRGPYADGNGDTQGKFLYLVGRSSGQLTSPTIPQSNAKCQLQMSIFQIGMDDGNISLVIHSNNKSASIHERPGNDRAIWEVAKFNLGSHRGSFTLTLEMYLPYENSSIALDNIQLVDCSDESRPYMTLNCDMFKCDNGACLDRNYVCDFRDDCNDGEDETRECGKLPPGARCNFEHGWCGWTNSTDRPMNWTLHHGPTGNDRMGPYIDHTYGNETGLYAYINITGNPQLGFGGTINSPIYNPPPPCHRNTSSLYQKSCKVRFWYHLYGQSVTLSLHAVELTKHENLSKSLAWLNSAKVDAWQLQVVTLPDIRHRYYLKFDASKGMTKGELGLDDFSLSPECFGIGIPESELGDYNYERQTWDIPPPMHTDFINETIIHVVTCGQQGRFGPTPEKCAEHYNGTEIEVLQDGVQRWTAPEDGFYAVIASGARGGQGALETGSSLGATVRGVVGLARGQELFFMVGQPGTNACAKNLRSLNSTCQRSGGYNSSIDLLSPVRQVKATEPLDGAGGGGGATYVYTLKANGHQQPLMIGGGGGGLGPAMIQSDIQHAKGHLPENRKAVNGRSYKEHSGGGGGWLPLPDSSNETNSIENGKALTMGGVGGVGCGHSNKSHDGNGGFGGGGGGCLAGGGGGGYAGGVTGHGESGTGEGGYSYVSPDLLFASYEERVNAGPGEAFIIPALSGCGCEYRCVAIDQHLSETRCLCPSGSRLAEDFKSCVEVNEPDPSERIYTIILGIVTIILITVLSVMCFTLYNRYQNRKALIRRRQVMFDNGTELASLRMVSDSMMTEFNPNYEFAGNLYSFKDLPQIPRDHISLVKPLGQGAFGEVYQGIYKYPRNEEHPVAVKTLPSLSTSQAEADFMMEALIMSKFDHPNIVHFIGVSFDKHPRYIILELLAGGDLKNFLREERPRPDRQTTLTMQNLIMCAYDVAKGCKYMEEARFIHRDIAARNCLLTCKSPGRVVKIADFGMARDIYRSDYYRKGGKAMLPIKWMPPESFLDGIFTTKTDVWAFGVLLWEIMSFGYMPYTGCANREVMTMVTSGGRLEKPAGCPDPIYGIMTRCWHPNPDGRPDFSTIVERIGYCLQDPDVINMPTPNYDSLPICEREITIMRPDPETECINVHAEVDGGGYMQPRVDFRPTTYRIGQPPSIIYTSLKHGSEDRENRNSIPKDPSLPSDDYQTQDSTPEEQRDLDNVCDNRANVRTSNTHDETNANVTSASASPSHLSTLSRADDNNLNNTVASRSPGHNGNGESNTDTNSDSLGVQSSGTPPDTASSSPNTRTSSPRHMPSNEFVDNGNDNLNNLNGLIKKNTLKGALSLDSSALCKGNVPYEKVAFSQSKQRTANAGGIELRRDSLSRELPREEECSC